MSKRRDSVRTLVLEVLEEELLLTNTQIASRINRPPAQVSSVTNRLRKSGVLVSFYSEAFAAKSYALHEHRHPARVLHALWSHAYGPEHRRDSFEC